MGKSKLLVSVILVAWNSRTELARCLPSLLAQDYLSYEVIVVDNASTDGTAEWLSRYFPTIGLLCNEENLGFAAAVNQGFALAAGEVLVELNPDTTVEPDWLFPLVEALQAPTVGLATPRIMLMSQPERINACGNEMSLTGLTFCIGVGEKAEAFMSNCSNDFRSEMAKSKAMATLFSPTENQTLNSDNTTENSDNPTENSDNPTENSDNPTENSDNPTKNKELSLLDRSPRAS